MNAVVKQEESLSIRDIIELKNVADYVTQSELDKIGSRVCEEFEIDRTSMLDWLDRNDLAMRLIDQKAEAKSTPWPNAANTKLPLVLNAALRISAEEYAEILRTKEWVSFESFGRETPEKIARGNRVKKRMNFQYQHELEDWQEDHDKLILSKSILGTVHKKYVWCAEKKQIECVLRRSGVVINNNVEHIQDAPRITDELEFFWWECESKFRSGAWKKFEITQKDNKDFAQSDKLQSFYEQLRREDIDGDGYPEPYVVTVHKDTRKVVSIVPNFTLESISFGDNGDVIHIDQSKSRVRYVKYDMVPSYEGGYWGIGFGILLGPLNDNCNALINQLIDAGTLANRGGGFVSGQLKMGKGPLKFAMGEWKTINAPGIAMRDAFFPIPVRDPSQTLFSLLGLLMETLRDLSSVTEVMSGQQPHANMAQGTIQLLAEQGKKVFNSIYKRHYASLKKEFKALFDLNFVYEDPDAYMRFHDMNIEMLIKAVPDLANTPPAEVIKGFVQGDFESIEMDILPAAAPEFSSKLQRMSEAQAFLSPEMQQNPYVDKRYATRKFALAVTDDEDEAMAMVPDNPNKTPEMIAQEMANLKQQIMDSAEVKTLQLQEQITAIQLQIAEVNLDLKHAEGPVKASAAQSKADSAEFKAEQAAAALDLINAQIRQTNADAQAQEIENNQVENG